MIGIANVVMIVFIATALIAYWFWLALPLMQAGERTKTELLAEAYTERVTDAVASGERDRIDSELGELLLLSETDSDLPLLDGAEIELADGTVIAQGDFASTLSVSSFVVEVPLFSEETFELLGTVRLYRSLALGEQRTVFLATSAVILLLLIGFQALLIRLLQPLRAFARNVRRLDPSRLDTLAPIEGAAVTREVRQLDDAVRDLLHRLDEARRLSEKQKESLEQHATELSRSNADLEQFAYVASHDLKAPLRAISNLAEWIEEDLEGVLEGESRRYMDMLRGRVQRLDKLLADLLSYSRVGRVESEVAVIDTHSLVEEIVADLAPPDGFTVEIVGSLPTLEAPHGPMEATLRNLINNAIKHHDRKDGTVRVRAEARDGYYEFQVSDDGPGIEPEFHDRIFQMFQTLQPRDKVEGSGMGLAIVKKMIETEGGKIWVESPGREANTTFHFTWSDTNTRKLRVA